MVNHAKKSHNWSTCGCQNVLRKQAISAAQAIQNAQTILLSAQDILASKAIPAA
jgi:hypothetical protein